MRHGGCCSQCCFCWLQAEFYSWSIFGVGLNSTLLGRAPSTDGAQKATLTAITQNYYTEVANDEINHVRSHSGSRNTVLESLRESGLCAVEQDLSLPLCTLQSSSHSFLRYPDIPAGQHKCVLVTCTPEFSGSLHLYRQRVQQVW